MNIEIFNNWFALIANLGVLAGIVFLAYEIQQNSQQLELDLVFQANQKIFENNRDLLDPELSAVFAKATTNPENLDYEEYLRASAYVLNLFNEWEDRFFIYEAGLISDEDWKSHVDENSFWVLGNSFAREFWEVGKVTYEQEFASYVDGLLPSIQENATHDEWLRVKQRLIDSNRAGQ